MEKDVYRVSLDVLFRILGALEVGAEEFFASLGGSNASHDRVSRSV
jgi:hypothetical protein